VESVTDVERLARPTTLRPVQGPRRFRWTTSILALVTVWTSTVTFMAHPANASNIANEKARAAALYRQIQGISGRVETLGQKYDQAQVKLQNLNNQIKNTKSVVAQIERNMKRGNAQLREDAVFAYVTSGSAASNNPLFSSNASSLGSTKVYNQLAQGNIAVTLAGLKNYEIRLTKERAILNAEDRQAAAAAQTAAKAFHEAQHLQATLQGALNQVKGQIAQYIRAQEAAAAAKAAGRLRHAHPQKGVPAPPPNTRAGVAIRAAESLLGVPYVWGGASRSGVDCSGLIMLAYAAAGIFFPHYSGAQYADTVRVPLFDLRPGDLLFWGWHGDQHVAMYLGAGKMIEAATTGTRVHITGVRFGYGFAGAGRPRA
jgi:cell wall-associated NlpC family hydrolase